MTRLRGGVEAAWFILFLCAAQFAFWYGLHLFEANDFARQLQAFDIWDSVTHSKPQRRSAVRGEIDAIPGRLLIFVRYWPQHPFQDEWVYNGADIDGQRVVWARDLGDAENRKLIAYYGDRKTLSLEPDARPPALLPYVPAETEQATPPPAPKESAKKPLLELEQVK